MQPLLYFRGRASSSSSETTSFRRLCHSEICCLYAHVLASELHLPACLLHTMAVTRKSCSSVSLVVSEAGSLWLHILTFPRAPNTWALTGTHSGKCSTYQQPANSSQIISIESRPECNSEDHGENDARTEMVLCKALSQGGFGSWRCVLSHGIYPWVAHTGLMWTLPRRWCVIWVGCVGREECVFDGWKWTSIREFSTKVRDPQGSEYNIGRRWT